MLDESISKNKTDDTSESMIRSGFSALWRNEFSTLLAFWKKFCYPDCKISFNSAIIAGTKKKWTRPKSKSYAVKSYITCSLLLCSRFALAKGVGILAGRSTHTFHVRVEPSLSPHVLEAGEHLWISLWGFSFAQKFSLTYRAGSSDYQMFEFWIFSTFFFLYINLSILPVAIKSEYFLNSQEDCQWFSSDSCNRKFCAHFWQMPLSSQLLAFNGFSAMKFSFHKKKKTNPTPRKTHK